MGREADGPKNSESVAAVGSSEPSAATPAGATGTALEAVDMPWLNDATLSLARKSDIVNFLQRHMSVELLKQHKLNGNTKSIAKKVSKNHLHKVYNMALKDPTMLVSEETKQELDEQSAAQAARQKLQQQEAEQAQATAQAAIMQQAEEVAAAAAAAQEADPAVADRRRHEATLTRWYTEYCPEKLPKISEVLDEYRGREYKLWQELGMQYGPEPAATYFRPQPAPTTKPSSADQTDNIPRLLEFAAQNNLTGLCCLVPGIKTKEVKPAPPPGQIEYVLTEPVTANIDVAHPNSGYTALMLGIAIADDDNWHGEAKFNLVCSFTHHLLEYGASTLPRSNNGSTALMMAAQRGRADVVRMILEFEDRRGLLSSSRRSGSGAEPPIESQAQSTINWESALGMSALHWAAAGEWQRADPSASLRASPPELVKLLLEAGASTNPPNSSLRMTPLMLACMHCRGDEALALRVVELLLRPPVPVPFSTVRSSVSAPTPHSSASSAVPSHDWRGKLPATTDGMRLPNVPLSHRSREEEKQTDADKEEAALVFGDVGLVPESLVPAPAPAVATELSPVGADPNTAARGGLRALHLAAVEGRCSIVRALLGAKADVDARLEPTNESAYNLAAAAGHLDVAAVLEAAGCDTTSVPWPVQQDEQAEAAEGTDPAEAFQDSAPDIEAGMASAPEPDKTVVLPRA